MPGGGCALPGLLVRLRLSVGPASNCAAGRWHQARSCVYAGWRLRLTRPTRPALTVCRPGKQLGLRRRAMASGTELRLCRVAASPYPAYSSGSDCLQARQATAPPGDGIRHGAAFMPGGGYALPGLQPQITAGAGAAETAGAGGLNIAETFPEGRGSPHGCGLRAVFCRDAASARPEACRDKSKGPRSGDVAGRSPGVQGAAATGRPLCAPSAMTAITQTINRERNRPGSNIEAVALLSAARAGTFPVAPIFRRVAAGVLPGLPRPLTGSHLVGPVSAAPPGDAIRHGAALLPGGGCALPGLLVRLRLSVGPVSAAPPGDSIRHGAAFMPGGGWRLTRPTGFIRTGTTEPTGL